MDHCGSGCKVLRNPERSYKKEMNVIPCDTINSTVNAIFFLTWLGMIENVHSVPSTVRRTSRNYRNKISMNAMVSGFANKRFIGNRSIREATTTSKIAIINERKTE